MHTTPSLVLLALVCSLLIPAQAAAELMAGLARVAEDDPAAIDGLGRDRREDRDR